MNRNKHNEPDRSDILGQKVGEMPRIIMPAGLDEKIMVRVRREAARLRRKNIFLTVLASVAGAAAVAGVVFAVLSYTGVDLSETFASMENLFSAEVVKAFDTPAMPVIICTLIVLAFYLSINGIINNRARQKALRKEYGLSD